MQLSQILIAFLILVCILLVTVILAQRSEGGALGMGGGPSGFMTARGAGNFLTRTTWILGGIFFACAILLIVLGNRERHASDLNSLKLPAAPLSSLKAQAPPGGPPAGTATTSTPPASPSAPNFGDFEQPSGKAAQPAPAPTLSPAPAPAPAKSSAPAQK